MMGEESVMPLGLQGLRALIGGSSQGIGLASAKVLSSLGCEVILTGRNEDRLQAGLSALNTTFGQNHGAIAADYTDLGKALDSILLYCTSNPGPIHIVVNNSGGPAPGPLLEANPEAFYESFTQHILMAQLLCQGFVPGMREAGYGRIINIISTSVKAPLHNLGVSNTIRGAMANWAKTMANEVGKYGITVNNVLPGATATERLQNIITRRVSTTGADPEAVIRDMQGEIPLQRFANPIEIGYAVAFLASPAAAYINGINLPVDGGRTGNL